MKEKRFGPVQICLSLLIFATVCFIWSNSLRGGEASSAQSGFYRDIFRQIFDVTKEPFRFLDANLRAAAHFSEFALLGAEITALLLLRRGRFLHYMLGFLSCAAVALLDEGIQFFVPGRVSDPADVLLDCVGALFGCLFAYAIGRLCRLFKKK